MLKTQNNLLDYLKKLAQVIEKARTAEVEINGEPAQIQAFAQAVAERELLVPVVGHSAPVSLHCSMPLWAAVSCPWISSRKRLFQPSCATTPMSVLRRFYRWAYRAIWRRPVASPAGPSGTAQVPAPAPQSPGLEGAGAAGAGGYARLQLAVGCAQQSHRPLHR